VRRRLLLVSHSLSGGGAERFASTLLTHLPRDLFEPALALATPRVTYPLPDDVAVTHLGYTGLAALPRALRALARRVEGWRPHLVLSNVLSTNCLAGGALALARWTGAWVARVGNDPRADPPLQRLWAGRVYPRARRVVANSRGLAGAVEESYPELAGRVATLPNPTDFDQLERRAAQDLPHQLPAALAPGGPVVVWMGRLVPQKRPDLALEALARLRLRVPARLWLCGDGPLAGLLQRRAAALGVAGAVRFLGFLDNPFPLLRHAAVFLSTSDHEGSPNALVEAQGLGVPAVATRCPYGPEEIIEDRVTGRLVRTGDGEGLAAALEALLTGEAARRSMGEAARRRARERFGLPVALDRWQNLLLEAAEAAP
jgi:glycosyltransferase involved in cell wall biosynthesis